MHERDRQTDGRTDTGPQQRPRLRIASRGEKANEICLRAMEKTIFESLLGVYLPVTFTLMRIFDVGLFRNVH